MFVCVPSVVQDGSDLRALHSETHLSVQVYRWPVVCIHQEVDSTDEPGALRPSNSRAQERAANAAVAVRCRDRHAKRCGVPGGGYRAAVAVQQSDDLALKNCDKED